MIAAGREPAPQGAVEYLIVGLGNPGTQYENTRHNAGFMAADTLAEKLGVQIKKLKFKSLIADCAIEGRHCIIMKPSTFMNNSGEAVGEAMNFYKIPPQNILVMYDDISLDVGRTRIRRKGSVTSKGTGSSLKICATDFLYSVSVSAIFLRSSILSVFL